MERKKGKSSLYWVLAEIKNVTNRKNIKES